VSDALIVHPAAEVAEGAELGDGTSVAAFAAVAAGAQTGARCVIGEHAFLAGGVVLADDVTVGPGAKLVGDLTVGPGVSIGANAVVSAAAIGRGAVVLPGAMVMDAVPANAIVQGNPAIITGYVTDEPEPESGGTRLTDTSPRVTPTLVDDVQVHRLTREADLRGSLMAAEFADLPFVPQRVFTVLDVPSEAVRGSHAHRECAQFLVCLSGSVNCLIDDGRARDQVRLEGPRFGLYMPPMIWGTQYKYSQDAVLLVLASHPYDPDDYIRDYDEFLEAVAQRA
jgi:carbonic anhydrase/acetyltransferase-like protein (isoleucine patch superfamily)/dTDP-4-dehydrorhamnose 3,5-epimerase-like enzyme